MLRITPHVTLTDSEIELHAVRAQGSGGQHVNKVSSAIHLRFDIRASSLPESYKGRLLWLTDRRITADGIVIIKAQRYRSQDKNRMDALARLQSLILSASVTPRHRMATQPTRASRLRRLESKMQRGRIKSLRRKVDD